MAAGERGIFRLDRVAFLGLCWAGKSDLPPFQSLLRRWSLVGFVFSVRVFEERSQTQIVEFFQESVKSKLSLLKCDGKR